MNLSKFTDYSFRTLIYLAKNNDRLCIVQEIAEYLDVSNNHMKKIVHRLAKGNFIHSIKGRTGGLRLAKDAKDINLGDVLVYCEDFSAIVECEKIKSHCVYNNEKCLIKNIVRLSTKNFIDEFRKYNLQDILDNYY